MSKRSSVFLSAISGNILEYYDFTVYAVFTLAIAQTFFPSDTPTYIKELLSLSVFAVGFVTRPLGGVVFGYIGDRFGRRIALIISMLGMTIPTFMIGLIPAYDTIGIYAPITLVLLRLIQGMCISGEGAGAAIFILEHYRNLRPGFTAGLVHGSNIAGTLLASCLGIILNYYFPATDFAWRFAFLLGGVMGIVGFYFRLRVAETPIFKKLAEKKKILKIPFIHVLQTAPQAIFVTFCLGGCASSIVYLVKSYTTIFFLKALNFDGTTALMLLSYASIVMMIAIPLSGYISDHVGRFKMIALSASAILLLSFPALYTMLYASTAYKMVALTILALLGGSISGSAYIFIISLFTPEQRFTGVAFSYNLGIAMFGGTSALISHWLVERTGLYYAPAFYISLTAGVFLAVIYITKDKIAELLRENAAEAGQKNIADD
jgi:MHS family proline/betaine transporter-like MFS transporter